MKFGACADFVCRGCFTFVRLTANQVLNPNPKTGNTVDVQMVSGLLARDADERAAIFIFIESWGLDQDKDAGFGDRDDGVGFTWALICSPATKGA